MNEVSKRVPTTTTSTFYYGLVLLLLEDDTFTMSSESKNNPLSTICDRHMEDHIYIN